MAVLRRSAVTWMRSTIKSIIVKVVKEMLELALDTLRVQESDEMDHVREANRRLAKATQLEHNLEKAAHEAYHDAMSADAILDTYEKD